MKGSFTLVASALAAAALTSTTSDRDVTSNSCSNQVKSVKSGGSSMKEEKYAPKLDGLRFIETLVTAHSWSDEDLLSDGGDVDLIGSRLPLPKGMKGIKRNFTLVLYRTIASYHQLPLSLYFGIDSQKSELKSSNSDPKQTIATFVQRIISNEVTDLTVE